MAKRVLITGARSAAALEIARDFAAAGWHVHLADSVPARISRWSAVPAQHHSYPPPRSQGNAFRKAIAELTRAYDFDLIVPTCEEVFHLAQPGLRQIMDAKLFAPPIEQLTILHDKLAFADHCEAEGLPVPESRAIETADDIKTLAPEARDWVVKSRFGRFGERTMIAPDPSELADIMAGPPGKWPGKWPGIWMAQRLTRGDEVCLHLAAYQGKLVHFAAYTSRWRLSGGACYAFEPLDPGRTEMLRELALQLVEAGGLHGQFGYDVIITPGGDPYLIECNPRATSGVHLMAGGGQLARAIADGIPARSEVSKPAYLGPAMLFFGLGRAVTTGQIREWASTLAAGTDAISRPGDRLPFFGAVIDTARFALVAVRRGISVNAATTYDIEWNGEDFEP